VRWECLRVLKLFSTAWLPNCVCDRLGDCEFRIWEAERLSEFSTRLWQIEVRNVAPAQASSRSFSVDPLSEDEHENVRWCIEDYALQDLFANSRAKRGIQNSAPNRPGQVDVATTWAVQTGSDRSLIKLCRRNFPQPPHRGAAFPTIPGLASSSPGLRSFWIMQGYFGNEIMHTWPPREGEEERRTLSPTNSAGILQLILLSPPLSQPDIEETLPTLQRWAFDTFGCSEISYE